MKKTMKKIVALGSGAALLVSASVMGTMAYLTAQTGEVSNVFTVGNVNIKLDEAPVDANGVKLTGERVTSNTYKLIPGKTYSKDPMVTVLDGSEECYVYVKVENGIASLNLESDADGDETIAAQIAVNWTPVGGNVYRYNETLTAGETAVVFENFTIDDTADISKVTNDTKITIDAFAIQSAELTVETANSEAITHFAK